jgi:hypothetical protein
MRKESAGKSKELSINSSEVLDARQAVLLEVGGKETIARW